MNYFRTLLAAFVIVNLVGISLTSCIREEDYADGNGVELKFGNDTVSFDTIFTTVSSLTKTLMVYNDESKKPQTSNGKSCNTDPSLDEAIKEAVEAKEETPEDKQRKLALSYIERVEREPNNGRLNGLLRMMQKNGTLEKLGIEWKPKAV